MSIVCANIGRDEDVYEESNVAFSFHADRDVTVQCQSVLFAPDKALIALVQVSNQEVDERLPHLPLLVNDFKNKAEISQFVRAACSGKGPFTGVASTLQTGGAVHDKKRYLQGKVSMGRDRPPTTAYMVTLP